MATIKMARVKLILQQPYSSKNTNGNGAGESATEATKTSHSGKNKKLTRAEKRKRQLNPRETTIYGYLLIRPGEMIKIKSAFRIFPKDWDFNSRRKKVYNQADAAFNDDLAKFETSLIAKYREIKEERPDLSFEQLSDEMKDYFRDPEKAEIEKRLGYFIVFDRFLDYVKQTKTFRTWQKFNTVKSHLQDFCEAFPKYQRLSFSQMDQLFLDDYLTFLRTKKPRRGRQLKRPEGSQTGLLIDSQKKHIENLKTFLKWAEIRGFNNYPAYKDFRAVSETEKPLQAEKNDVVALTLDELRRLYAHDFSKTPELERVRDLFCFACFTGQRWGDIERFQKDQVSGDVWSFKAGKTKKRTKVFLTGFASTAIDILKKYNFELPLMPQPVFNILIKQVGERVGINSETIKTRYVDAGSGDILIKGPKYNFLSSHVGRATCLSILLNDFGLPVSHVQQLARHADIKTTQKYIADDEVSRQRAMANKTRPIFETDKLSSNKAAV